MPTSPEEAHDIEVVENSVISKNKKMGIIPHGPTYIPNTETALAVFENHPMFNGNIWFDEFHQKYYTTYNTDGFGKIIKQWDNEDSIRISVFIQRELQISRMSDDTVNKAMRVYAKNNIKNEPRDWMNSLIWDGQHRIETFFVDCAGAQDNEYTRAVSKNFWIGIAARIFNPGCKLDTMPILEGGQGEYKSTLLNIVGGKWHCEASHDLYSKDFFQGMHGKMIIEFADLSGFNKSEVNTIKDILTRRVDYIRLPYAALPQDFPRQSVFAGTTNKTTYLKDETGARRFWPIRIGKIDIIRAKEERSQLFSEAVACFKKGDNWWSMPSQTEAEQEERRETDPWEDVISHYLMTKNEVSSQDILKDCLCINASQQTRPDEMRVGAILRLLNWERKQKWFGSKKKWMYCRPDEAVYTEDQQHIDWED